MLSVRRSLAAAALAPLALTGLVACGSDSGSTSASDPTSTSASPSSASPSASAGSTIAPADFTSLLQKGLDSVTTAHLTMSADLGTTGSMKGTGDVDYSKDSPEMAMKLSSDMTGGDIDMRLVDKIIYMNLGKLSGNKFLKIDLGAANSPFGAMGSQLDPKSSLQGLEKGLTSVTYVGQEDVDGQSLDHYKATADPKKFLDGMGSGASAGASALPDEFDYDVWFDGDGRFTKLTLGMGSEGKVEMSLSDFGADVSIEAPPASQVTKMPAGMGMGGSVSS